MANFSAQTNGKGGGEAMTSEELGALISEQLRLGSGGEATRLTADRNALMRRYFAEPYGDEEPDRSKVVSNNVCDTVEWLLPELIDIFTSGDSVVVFDPQGQEDEEAAQQETDTVNYVFTRQNDGFLVLYSWFKDGLLQKNGYVKRSWRRDMQPSVQVYRGLNMQGVVALQAALEKDGKRVEIVAKGKGEDIPVTQPQTVPNPQTGQPMPNPQAGQPVIGPDGKPAMEKSLDVKLRIWSPAKCVVEPVPPEEIVVANQWGSVFLRDCPFVAHQRLVARSVLYGMGYDREQVDRLPVGGWDFTSARTQRFSQTGESLRANAVGKAMEEVMVAECWVMCDFDGDGLAERRRVMVGGHQGGDILKFEDGAEDNDEVDDVPIHALTPIIVPHRHIGRSVAELVVDLARIHTVLKRQMLDNIYLNNFPSAEIVETGMGDFTQDDWLARASGKMVRVKQPGTVTMLQPPLMINDSLQAIEFMATEQENRTGSTRYNQGLDANSLNKTATGISRIMNAAQKKLLLIARIFAETGVKDLFRGIHRDLSRYGEKTMALRLRNKWIDVDPSEWSSRADMSVQVGLGTGNKDQMLGHLTQLWQAQMAALPVGVAKPGQLYNTGAKIVQNMGLKTPELYFTDPATQPPQQPQPNPELMKIQLEGQKLQADGQKAQTDAQIAAARLQLDEKIAVMANDVARDTLDANVILGAAKIGQERLAAQLEAMFRANDQAHQRTQAQLNAVLQAHQQLTGAQQAQDTLAQQDAHATADREAAAAQAEMMAQAKTANGAAGAGAPA